MAGAMIGWFGKLPSHGDFLQRRAPPPFVAAWDEWLQRCIGHSRETLQSEWLNAYLTSPVWRFMLSGGVIGASTYAGILLPSVDRVGRYFPLTIVAELPSQLPPMAVAIQGRDWFRQIEAAALAALGSQDFDIDDFDAALQSSARSLAAVERYVATDLGESFPETARCWRMPVTSVDRMPAALIDPLLQLASQRLRPLTLWWSDGSERVGASCLMAQSLPDETQYVAMLDGNWSGAGWAGEFTDHGAAAAEPLKYRIVSAALTETGPVRTINQDRVLDRPEAGLWAVADGMGGHSRGEYASQLAVDVLNSLEPAATLDAALSSVRVGLDRANGDLLRSALRQSDGSKIGTTIVALTVRHDEWGVLWAGDSRAYLLRDGILRSITRDHSGDDKKAEFDAAAPPASTGEISRALGGHDVLELDCVTGAIQLNDRFLLCSDGLHGAIDHPQLTSLLAIASDPQAAVGALVAKSVALASRDNVSAVVVDIYPLEA